MRRYILLLQLIMVSGILPVCAQKFVVNVPSQVSVGENFRLVYTIDTQNAKDFHIGNIPKALEMITGPYTSRQTSYQMVNGHTTGSSSITFTFILCATKNGVYTIPPAQITANGKRLASKAAKVKVSGDNNDAEGSPRMHEDSGNERLREAGTPINGSDLFIKVSANKQRVHEQEPILLTYKVYTLVDLTQLDGKMPDLTGFHTQEIPLPQQKSFHIERVNGRPYRCVTWSQYIMYPQMTGKLEIPGITFNGTVIQQNRDVDPFEAFLNGGSGYIEVKRAIKAPSLTIQVDPLPKRPANFSGGVGKFNISAQLNKTEVKANDPITIRVVISGTGNLKLIKQPKVKFPTDFDKYDAKVTDKTKLTKNGVEGNMIYDFLAVPRNQGNYVIPAIEFTYYDIGTNSYKTIKTQQFNLNVAKGDGNANTAVDYSDLKDKDIHPIKEGDFEPQDIANMFYGSTAYWIILSASLIAFTTILIVFRKRAIDNADITKLKIKKANRMATKRLRYASTLMLKNDQERFYDEVLRALWGYVGDKLNMPIEQLSKDNIADELSNKCVDEDTVSMFMRAIDECEYNRYAPGDPKGNMSQTFDAAMTAIIKIEDALSRKKKRHDSHCIALIFTILMFCIPVSSNAITKKNADDEYKKGNYQQAIRDYEELLKKGQSAELFYNLGNAYYRTENITKAVLNYERALLLSPGDDDIRFNLQMARSKTIDKITPKSEMFFVTWYKSLVNFASVDGWAHTAVVSLAVALVLVLCYLFGRKVLLRKISFYGAAALILLFIFSNIFAYKQRQTLTMRTGAIITSPSVTLKKTPVANGENGTIVHEGSRVEIIDDTMKDWKLVELEDGREGWIQNSQMERI